MGDRQVEASECLAILDVCGIAPKRAGKLPLEYPKEPLCRTPQRGNLERIGILGRGNIFGSSRKQSVRIRDENTPNHPLPIEYLEFCKVEGICEFDI